MQLSSYPPGVSPFDPHIVGALWEEEKERYCPECEDNVMGIDEGYTCEVIFFHDTKDGIHDIDVTNEYFDGDGKPLI